MKKTIIALAVAGFSLNATAIDLSATTPVSAKYASEIVLPSLLKENAGTAFNTTVAVGNEIAASVGDVRYVRFEFGNAEIASVITEDTDLTISTATNKPTIAHVAGGTAGSTYVVFSLTGNAAAATPATDKLTLDVGDLYAKGGDVTVSYKMYTDVTSATTGADTPAQFASATKSGTLATFTPALNVKVTKAGAANKIEVGSMSKKFVGDVKTVDLAKIAVDFNSNVFLKDGTAATGGDFTGPLTSAAKLTVNGDFSGGAKKADGSLDFTKVLKVAGATVDAANSTEQAIVFNVTKVDKNTAGNVDAGTALVFEVDGETELLAQNFTAEFAPVAETGYKAEKVALDLGKLERNAQNAEVKLGLSRNTGFNQFVRVVNESNVKGIVKFVVKDDAGVSEEVLMSELAGYEAELEARTAAKPVNVKDLFDAAKAKNAELSDKGMLRISVYGEVGQTMDVQSYVVGANGAGFGVTSQN